MMVAVCSRLHIYNELVPPSTSLYRYYHQHQHYKSLPTSYYFTYSMPCNYVYIRNTYMVAIDLTKYFTKALIQLFNDIEVNWIGTVVVLAMERECQMDLISLTNVVMTESCLRLQNGG